MNIKSRQINKSKTMNRLICLHENVFKINKSKNIKIAQMPFDKTRYLTRSCSRTLAGPRLIRASPFRGFKQRIFRFFFSLKHSWNCLDKTLPKMFLVAKITATHMLSFLIVCLFIENDNRKCCTIY